MTMTPGVAVPAVDNDNVAYLTSQFWYALGEESLEAMTGEINEGENPNEAARRKLGGGSVTSAFTTVCPTPAGRC
jgi:hypothetical protein